MPSAPPSPTIPLTTYLLTRLHQLHLRSIHGVPGDYNLTLLDHVAPAHLTWIGSCNELNAAYATDGYARLTGLGALVTAFGVGELSALNAIAGAYAEMSAVVHIVGTPPRSAQQQGTCLHHSFGAGDFRVFARMAKEVTVAQANLVEEDTAAAEVDRVLRECILQSRPVYIEVPTDMVNAPVDAGRLDTPINTSWAVTPQEVQRQRDAEARALEILLPLMQAAQQPFLIIDGFSARHGTIPLLDALVRLLGWPTTSTPFGKSCVDETLANFHGIYAGIAGREGKAGSEKAWVDNCDLVLRFGGLDSDVNTYGFSTLTPPASTVNFHRDRVVFGPTGETVPGIQIHTLLHTLLATLTTANIPRPTPYPTHLGDPAAALAGLAPPDPRSAIAQHDFWRRISAFFRAGDVILTETGTASVGSREFVLPRHARLVNSSLWLSIGFMLPAAQGAAVAVREARGRRRSATATATAAATAAKDGDVTGSEGDPGPVLDPHTCSGRTILMVGDGSFQMSCQELSTVIRYQLPLTLFLINNDGYTIERFIHGMRAEYNDVARWRYLAAPAFFGGRDVEGVGVEVRNGGVESEVESVDGELKGAGREAYRIQTHQARTWGELAEVLAKPEVRSGEGLCMIEIFMDREDAPESLKKLVRGVKRRNSGAREEGEESGRGKSGGRVNGVDGSGALARGEEEKVQERVVKIAG